MKDHFSKHASQYAAFRPSYPRVLYDFILLQTRARHVAWDCACGNGQVAKDLSPDFDLVYGTDISQKQLDNAFQAGNITYSVSPAERSPFADNSIDLITVGQALHWFRIKEFFAEAGRVGKPGSTLAVWGYGLLSVNREIDAVMNDFYFKEVGPYWDPERKLIDERYASIHLPFERIAAPEFEFSFHWTLDQLNGYLCTWSSVQKFIHEKGINPVPELIERISPMWKGEREKVFFPLFVQLGRIG
jgi:hypothetical protein